MGTNYGERNFTKLFGTRTARQTFEKLQEVKTELSKNNNPFKKQKGKTVNDYFNEFIKTQTNGDTKFGVKYRHENTYNKFIKETIQNKNISDVTEDDIQYILDVVMKDKTERTKTEVRTVMNPLIKQAIKDSVLTYSVLDDIKFSKKRKKDEITYRVRTDLTVVVQRLYNAILRIEDVELKIIFLIALMCGRRKGEILKLEYSYIKNNKVYAPRAITKTSVTDEYILPSEVVDLLTELDTYNKGKLFTCKNWTPSTKFNSLVKQVDIEYSENNSISISDTRTLFSSIMSTKTHNTDLVDRCLTHIQTTVRGHYQSFDYKSRKEIFEQYWKILRG